ncbi:hypothetical protein KIN20_010265 [Parelaphostrongylus tenuis]|uniref:Uncharacterized protein n=1 Tax=Parelaphostrongylus tenuis TaxID=148309 RepID=A0AAD5QLR5_PARTN|nr:hypothetical protein KIN20_010265 [Parelaphostrongylus tenuis]
MSADRDEDPIKILHETITTDNNISTSSSKIVAKTRSSFNTNDFNQSSNFADVDSLMGTCLIERDSREDSARTAVGPYAGVSSERKCVWPINLLYSCGPALSTPHHGSTFRLYTRSSSLEEVTFLTALVKAPPMCN